MKFLFFKSAQGKKGFRLDNWGESSPEGDLLGAACPLQLLCTAGALCSGRRSAGWLSAHVRIIKTHAGAKSQEWRRNTNI
jgi:hypothetical protein